MKNLKLFLATAVLSTCAIAANELPLRTDLNEKVLMIPVDKTFYGGDISLETTLFKPDGNGPFPLIVINEGKTLGNPSFQPRARYPLIAKEFLKRGYAVALPMQRGFSQSGGSTNYMGEGCRRFYESTVEQTADIKKIIEALGQRPDIDANKVIVAGQSFGGLSTLGLASTAPAGVKLLINFAGGVKNDSCKWEEALNSTVEKLGENAKLSSLWFYGENDSLFSPKLSQQMYANFTKNQKTAELINYGKYRDDAHIMFGTQDGFDTIWWPVLEKKLASIGMPTAVVNPVYSTETALESSGYAAIDDLTKLPAFASQKCKEAYGSFIKERSNPRAFAIAENGRCGMSWSLYDDVQYSAIAYCKQLAKDTPCKVYLVDDKVVWPKS